MASSLDTEWLYTFLSTVLFPFPLVVYVGDGDHESVDILIARVCLYVLPKELMGNMLFIFPCLFFLCLKHSFILFSKIIDNLVEY